MASKTSRLNLVKPQQAQKEVVVNAVLNALSPGAFGGKNEQATSGLVFGLYGGYRNNTDIANATVNLNDNTNNYVYFNNTSKAFEVSTSGFGDYPCYLVTTSNGVITDWQERRDPLNTGSASAGDPNFKGSSTPTTAPKATNTNSIAIGDSSESSGYNSFSAMTGKAYGQSTIAFGQNNTAYSNYSLSFGGFNNSAQATYASIFSGRDNTISAQSDYNCILNSYQSTIGSSAYNYNTIISSNQSSSSGKTSFIISGSFSYIQADVEGAGTFGKNGNVDISYTHQFSYGSAIKKQFSGLFIESTSVSEYSLKLGDGIAVQKNFKLRNNQVANVVITLLGATSSGSVILFKEEVLLKRFSDTTTIVGSSVSTTEQAMTKIKSDTPLNSTTARVIAYNNELYINAIPTISDSIYWTAIVDSTILSR